MLRIPFLRKTPFKIMTKSKLVRATRSVALWSIAAVTPSGDLAVAETNVGNKRETTARARALASQAPGIKYLTYRPGESFVGKEEIQVTITQGAPPLTERGDGS
jgi:hypothetical protein